MLDGLRQNGTIPPDPAAPPPQEPQGAAPELPPPAPDYTGNDPMGYGTPNAMPHPELGPMSAENNPAPEPPKPAEDQPWWQDVLDKTGTVLDTARHIATFQAPSYDENTPSDQTVLGEFLSKGSGEQALRQGVYTGGRPIDSSNLPDAPYLPLRQAVDVAASPLTIATLGLGGEAVGPLAAAKVLGTGTAGYVAQQQTEKNLPEWVPEPLAQALGLTAAVGAGVLTHKIATDPAAILKPTAKVFAEGGALGGERGSLDLGAFSKDAPPPARGTVYRPGDAGAPPPVSPAFAASVPRPPLPELGYTAADRALAMKTETMQPQGAIVSRMPAFAKRMYGALLNPAATQDPRVARAYSASQAEGRPLATEMRQALAAPEQELRKAWNDAPPSYIGPADNRYANTIKDFADNPEHYAAVPPTSPLGVARTTFHNALESLALKARTEYGVDIGVYDSGKPDSFYLPTFESKAAMNATQIDNTARSLGTSGKPRAYEGAYQRSVANPTFTAETELSALVDHNVGSITSLAKNGILKRGAGGLTKAEVMAKTHPELVEARYAAMADVTSLTGKLATATRTAGASDTMVAELQKAAEAVRNAAPDETYSPLETALRQSGRQIDAFLQKGEISAAKAAELRSQLSAAQDQLDAVRKRWSLAKPGDYVRSPVTNLYHTPEAFNSLRQVTERATNGFEKGIIGAFDENRASHLAGDLSPSAIQTPLAIAADPVHGVQAVINMIFNHSTSWDDVLAREPQRVHDFQFHTGTQLNTQSAELSIRGADGLKGLGRIPIAGPRIAAVEDTLFRFSQRISYEVWKAQSDDLMKMNPGMSRATADAQAAKYQGRIVPHINLDDRGISERRAGWERVPLSSTSFATAPILQTKDFVSGIAKLARPQSMGAAERWRTLSGAEQLAVKGSLRQAALASSLVAGSAVLTAKVAGKDPVDALWESLTDPSSRKFGAIQIPGTDRTIPLPGPMRGFLKLALPNETNNHIPFSNIIPYSWGKVSSPINQPINLVRNQDWQGNKIREGDTLEQFARSLMYLGEGSEPTTIGAVSAGVRTGQAPGDTAEDATAQFLGSNVGVASPTEQFDELAKGKGQPNFDQADVLVKAALIKDHPSLYAEYQARQSDAAQAYQGAREIIIGKPAANGEAATGQWGLDDAAQSGQITRKQWVDQYGTLRDKLAGAGLGLFGPEKHVDNPTRWQDQYGNILFDAQLPGGLHDWGKVDAAVAELPQSVQDNIAEQRGLGTTPMVTQYKQAQQDRSYMFNNIPKYQGVAPKDTSQVDRALTDIRNLVPPKAPVSTQLRALGDVAQKIGLTPAQGRAAQAIIYGTLKRMPANIRLKNGKMGDARQAYAEAHPLLEQFFGAGDFQ